MIPILMLVSLAVAGAWLALVIRAGRAARSPGPTDPDAARRLNRGLLAMTTVAALTTLAAPVAPLVAGFGEVAATSPERKAEVLERVIEQDRPLMPLALLSLPILGVGVAQYLGNRRRLRGS